MRLTPGYARPAALSSPGRGLRTDPSRLVLVVSIVLAVALVLYGASAGPRGSDQYWYIADAQTLAAGQDPVSNTLFPSGLLNDDGPGEYRPAFYHNGPSLHLVATLDAWLPGSTHATWVGLNLVCLGIIVAASGTLLRRRTTPEVARWTMAFAVLAPVCVWQSANALREVWYGALLALALLLFLHPGQRYRTVRDTLLTGVLGTGALAHPMFVILLVLLMLLRGLEWLRQRDAARLARIAPPLIALLIVLTQADDWFPSSFQPSLAAIISSAIPGVTNMAYHFSDSQVPIDAPFLWIKFLDALVQQFGSVLAWVLYLPLNLALLAWLALAWRHAVRRTASVSADIDQPASIDERELITLGLLLGLYVSMVVLQQNQMRFQLLVAPAAFLLIGHAQYTFVPSRWLPWLALPVLLGCAAGSLLMAERLRSQAVGETRDRAATAALFESVGPNERVLFVGIERHDPLSYVLRPTPALFIRPELTPEAMARAAIERFRPSWLVTRDADLPYGLQVRNAGQRIDTPRFGALQLRHLRQRP